MELSTLRFVVETDQLEDAAKKIDALGVSVSKINKPLQELSKNSEKAADSSNKAAKASESKSKAIEKESENASKLAKLLENLTNKQYDLSTGSTSAEASVLKLARSFGATTQEALKPFKEILEEIRKLSSNPFDSAIGSVRSITQEYDALNQRAELASKGIYLTTNQLKEFSKISNELKGQFKAAQIDITGDEGLTKFNAELKKQQDVYLGIATNVNTLKAAEKDRNDILNTQLKEQTRLQEASDNLFKYNQLRHKQDQDGYNQDMLAMRNYYAALEKEANANKPSKSGATSEFAMDKASEQFYKNQIKSQKDAAKAAAYVADVEARLAAALDTTNSALDKQATDGLVKYEKALKAAGFSADQAATKLAATREQFNSVADKKQADKLQYLARAISVQMGDVGISLASGMNPLLVMIQQGDQIRGAIQQAGAEGKDLERAMAGAATQIATSFIQTGQAIGGFFVNAIKSAGTGAVDFFLKVTRINNVLENMRYQIALAEGSSGLAMKTFLGLGTAVRFLAGATIAFALVSLVALAKGLADVVKEEDALTRRLILTGASLGVNTVAATAYAKSLEGVGVNTGKALKVMELMAKEGGFVAADINKVTIAATELEKYAGVSLEDTVKQFAKLKKEPVEALSEVAKATGLVSPEILKLVYNLDNQGKKSEAASTAIKAYTDVTIEQIARMKRELSSFAIVAETLSSTLANFYEKAIKSLWRKTSPIAVLENEILDYEKRLKRGINATPETKAENEEVLKSLREQLRLAKQAADLDQTRISDASRLSKTLANFELESAKYASNEMKRNKALAEAESKYAAQVKSGEISLSRYKTLLQNIRDEYKDPEKPKPPVITIAPSKDLSIIQKDYNEQLRLAEGFARDERNILKARFDAGLIDRADFITSDTALLLQAEQKQLDVINSTSQRYAQAYQDQFNLLFAALGNAKDKDNRQKLLDDITNLGKEAAEFFATLEDKKGALGSAFSSREVTAVLGFAKAANESNKELKEFLRLSGVTAQNLETEASLRDRLAGASEKEAEQIKAISAATKSQVAELSKLMEMRKDALVQYQKTLADPNASGTVRAEAYRAYITAMENANTAIAVSDELIRKAGVDAVIAYEKKERDRINSAITDSIVTALIEGGESGGKKLRSILEAELRRPITVFVRAIVDSLTGGATGAAASAGGNFLSSMGGSLLSSTLGSISVGGGTLAAAGSAFGTGFMTTLQGGSIAEAAGIYSAAGMQGVSTGLSAGATLAQYVPEIAIALAIGNALGVFRSTKQVGGGISGTLGGTGSVDQYGLMRKSGTLFNGPSYFRQGQGTFAGNEALQQTFNQLKTSTKMMADTLKLSSAGIEDFTKVIDISFDGLTDAQRQEKLASTFKGINDELAALVLGAGATAEQLSTLYNNVMQQRYDLETQLLELQGKTLELRERERAKIYDANKGLFDQIKALEDHKAKTEAAAVAMEKLTSVTSTIVDEINRLRGVSTSQAGLESQFAILTAQIRSSDDINIKMNALAQLPEITKGLEQIAASSAVNATDIIFARARLAQSLQDTLGYFPAGTLSTATTSVATLPSVATASDGASVSAASSNQELLAALVIEVQGLRAEVRADVSHNAKTAKILERVNQDGDSLTVTTVTTIIDGGVV